MGLGGRGIGFGWRGWVFMGRGMFDKGGGRGVGGWMGIYAIGFVVLFRWEVGNGSLDFRWCIWTFELWVDTFSCSSYLRKRGSPS